MSVPFTVLIKSKEPKSTIVSAIESILNCRLERTFSREEYHSAVVFGVGISLLGSVPANDDEIKYSNYDYRIMVEYNGMFDREYSDDIRRIMSIVLANMFYRNLNCECIALENLDKIVGEFIPESASSQ